jgi:hypothetical protein
MIKNDLSKIFNALKDHHDKKLVLYKKIAGISLLSRYYLCCNTFMTSLDDVVSIYKGITIDNVISLNVYENPSFCCTLFMCSRMVFQHHGCEFEVVFYQEQWSWCFFVTEFQGGRIHYLLSR